ncbi:hypothetical protein [Aureimonas endophytica]|uniref:hypothetical protein n=1 Tax=Aureimonas endophytica TaxID=2027858 RepID=UPI001AEEECAA|nr:hypothetical protein [Aureimonas endophytica]
MSRSLAPVVLGLLIGLNAPAQAGFVFEPRQPPSFTAAETQTIARNASLRRALAADPWLVRDILDELDRAAADDGNQPEAGPETGNGSEADPDLGRLDRSSPEAAYDLFILMKKVGGGEER